MCGSRWPSGTPGWVDEIPCSAAVAMSGAASDAAAEQRTCAAGGPHVNMPKAMVSVAVIEGDAAEFTILQRSDEYRLTLILAPAFQMYNQLCRAVAARPAEVDIWLSLRSHFSIAALSAFATPALACGGYGYGYGYGSCGCGCGTAGYAAPLAYGYAAPVAYGYAAPVTYGYAAPAAYGYAAPVYGYDDYEYGYYPSYGYASYGYGGGYPSYGYGYGGWRGGGYRGWGGYRGAHVAHYAGYRGFRSHRVAHYGGVGRVGGVARVGGVGRVGFGGGRGFGRR